jgi:hypothetical protein
VFTFFGQLTTTATPDTLLRWLRKLVGLTIYAMSVPQRAAILILISGARQRARQRRKAGGEIV